MIPAYVLIIGAMKSGTTSLFRALARHPQIAACSKKEPGFFAFEETWALGFDWYEGLFDFEQGQHAYALEATTDYSKFPFCNDVVRRLNESKPRRFKLIYIVRHPLRRIESQARHAAHTWKEVGQCTSPRPDHSLDYGISPVALAASSYAQQLDQYEHYYDRGDLFLVTLESFSQRPRETIRDIYAFLGIDESGVTDDETFTNSAALKKIKHPIWTHLRSIKPLKGLAKVVPSEVKVWLEEHTRVYVRPEGRYTLSPEEEDIILARLSSDLRRLRDRYRLDVEREWGININSHL